MNLTLRPMEGDDLSTYIARGVADYVKERIASGERPAEAERLAQEQTATLFPGGRPAEGQLLYRVLDDKGKAVGSLWIGPQRPDQREAFWVFDVEIDEDHRGEGLGRAVMLLAEDKAREHGASELGLNVFGHNAVARHLYESLGYETTAIQMLKRL